MDFTWAKNGPTIKFGMEISFTYFSRQYIIKNLFPTQFVVRGYFILYLWLASNKSKKQT